MSLQSDFSEQLTVGKLKFGTNDVNMALKVPKEIKDLAFRKPFSKKHKEHILSVTFIEMPSEPNAAVVTNEIDSLNLTELFEAEDDDSEFLGF